MRFKKGDLLTAKNQRVTKPVARVEKVTSEGVVHCVNLVACDTMKRHATKQSVNNSESVELECVL